MGVLGGAGCLGSGDEGDSENGNGGDTDESAGTAEIRFLGETYTFDDASCEGSRTFPPENEQIRHRDVDEGVEFWVERYDPEESDAIEVNLSFPTGGSDETIGEIEAYGGETTVDAVEFELGTGTSGSLHLDPSSHMNDDVEHDPDGGEVEWDISC
ncbi:hypothetical protein [Natronococcus pandeyae]|uniref:hypothetical protein n=1 Tax=Natronococcus pandeyae TaxID=2055836 RepID=UPI001F2D113C|nr:hypothetical protein [Natronococcus pandeyae]